MSLLKNLHKSRIALRVDQVNVRIEVAVFERVQSFYFLTIELLLLILFLLSQIVLCQISVALDFADPLLVELKELFLSIQNYFEELLSLGTASQLLAAAHLLLKPV